MVGPRTEVAGAVVIDFSLAAISTHHHRSLTSSAVKPTSQQGINRLPLFASSERVVASAIVTIGNTPACLLPYADHNVPSSTTAKKSPFYDANFATVQPSLSTLLVQELPDLSLKT